MPAARSASAAAACRSAPDGQSLLGYAGILLGGRQDELRPFRTGSLFLAYDLAALQGRGAHPGASQQSLYWAGWVTALALAMWLVFHFLLTRRTARLVQCRRGARGRQPRRCAAACAGHDELGRLGRAFDAMALEVARDADAPARRHRRAHARTEEALRVSEASYRAIFDAAEDVIFVHDIETGAIVDVNPKACSTFGYTRDEFRRLDLGALGSGVRPYTREGVLKISRARAWPASSSTSSGTAARRTARCAGTRCSASA